MDYIELDKKDIIAKGGERTCYLHPQDNTKLIKIVHMKGKHNQQNLLEHIYMSYLKKKKKDLSQVAHYYGQVNSNLGSGLVYERIMDYDNNSSKSFRYYVTNRSIPKKIQKELIEELRLYLETNSILFVDTSMTNIFCKKINEKNYKLIIVDGLGAKRLGYKFWFYRNCKLYTKYKIKRQWDKFMEMYEKDIRRVKKGVRPFTRL
ncbi:MAG: PhoP regulatory network YrbL family protein [Sulfurimonas sp.]|nr:PhoP regulatory network YrbL family protein [Sulfurimonas sp.]